MELLQCVQLKKPAPVPTVERVSHKDYINPYISIFAALVQFV